MTLTVRQTQDQRRAADAWENTKNVIKEHGASGEVSKKYKSLVKSAPADIQTSGLAQAIAFWQAKNKPHRALLYKHLSKWMSEVNGSGITGGVDLQTWITSSNTDTQAYRRATVEALAYLGWLKRFVEAGIEGSASDPD